ncbi:TetR/AcrR family transcriptional regulator [Thermodesulfobacteriota bacterium]
MHRLSKSETEHPTKGAILDAAQKVFIERGFGNTSMSMIAKEAKVTKSLIHHHFGSKDRLWYAVKLRRLEGYYRLQREQLEIAEPDAKCLKGAMMALFYLLKNDPELVRLIAWRQIDKDHLFHEEEKELTSRAVEKIAEAQRKGNIRDDVDPHHIIVSFFSLVVHWFLAKHEYLQWGGVNTDYTDHDEKCLEGMIKIFFEGVVPR